MLELAILGLLKEQTLHGYELKKRLADTFGGGRGASYGSLYPALGRLEASGAVTVVLAVSTAAVPMTGSLGGELAAFRARRAATRGARGKKVYAITERGEQLFAELLTAKTISGEDERLFNLRLAFAKYLPPGARLGMLERRRAHLVDRLGSISARVRTSRDRLDSYARSLLEHDQESTEHDLTWIERLIDTERASAEAAPEGRRGFDPAAFDPAAFDPAASDRAAGHRSLPELPINDLPDRAAVTVASNTAGSYRPSLSGLRPPTSEEKTR